MGIILKGAGAPIDDAAEAIAVAMTVQIMPNPTTTPPATMAPPLVGSECCPLLLVTM